MQSQVKKRHQQGMQSKLEMKSKLNPQLVRKYKEVFDSYDKQDSLFVLAKDVPAIMKMLGVTINQQDIIEILGEKVQKSENPLLSCKIDFTDFLTLIVDKDNEITIKQELMESFCVFDQDKNGSIPVNQMRYYLKTYGIAMSQDEVQGLIKDSQPENGDIKYQKFINNMFGLKQYPKSIGPYTN